MPGTLFVCATPIGNLEDITLRALRVLREVDLIVGEDTRRTRKLLAHYGISTPFAASLYEGVEEKRVPEVLALLEEGKSVALVCDAGTPLISDPGFLLVHACREKGIPVVPVPGPAAFLVALVGSGLPADRFQFWGYLPRSAGKRRRALEELRGVLLTTAFYESPHRLLGTLEVLAQLFPQRMVVVARELTKVHEEFVRGSAQQVVADFARREEILGEAVVLVGPDSTSARARQEARDPRALWEELVNSGLEPGEALREVARRLHLPRREVYRLVHVKVDHGHTGYHQAKLAGREP